MVSGLVNEVKYQKSTPKEVTCPKCSKGTIIKGKSAFGCNEWSAGCDFKIAFNLEGVLITYEEAYHLISEGQTKYSYAIEGRDKPVKFVLTSEYTIEYEKELSEEQS